MGLNENDAHMRTRIARKQLLKDKWDINKGRPLKAPNAQQNKQLQRQGQGGLPPRQVPQRGNKAHALCPLSPRPTLFAATQCAL